MIDNDRRKKLRVFLRVGLFAIATALSAVALIRILALTRQIHFTQQQLDAAQSAGEDLGKKNEQLLARVSLQEQHRTAAIRNDAYITRFYQLSREPHDLPPLKTDFIVRNHKSDRDFPVQFAFSVPEGAHTLKIAIQQNKLRTRNPITNLTFPLLPSSGYIIRIQPDAKEAENEVAQLSFELTSNNADFKPVRQPLPCSISQLDAIMREQQEYFRARLAGVNSVQNKIEADMWESHAGRRALHNELVDQQMTMVFNLRKMPLAETRGEFENISYPNSVVDLNQVFGFIEQVEIASCHAISTQTSFTLRLSVVSDAPECVSAETAATLNGARGRLQPYTGNGRFYLRPNN